MTDLPDAVVNAAVEAMKRIVPNEDGVLWEFDDVIDQRTGMTQPHPVTLHDAARAALAAASGPWAEQLDAARAERDAARERLAETYVELGLTHLVTEGQLDSIQTQADRIKSSDKAWSEAVERASKAEAQLDAALARNAECPNCGAKP